jgi:hypothetical protein
MSYAKLTSLEYITYPLFFQINKESTLKDLTQQALNRLKELKFFNLNAYDYYKNKKEYNSLFQINYIHGKETKKEGFFATYFSFVDKCKYCSEENEKLFYCPIKEDYKLKISEVFNGFKAPIKLAATSKCFNIVGNSNVINHYLINSEHSKEGQSSSDLLLKDCLDLFGKEDDLKDDDMWYCSKCQKLQLSKQKLQIYKSPYYLIIQLKRFNVKKNFLNESSFSGEKKNNFVTYPINDFDLSEYIVGPEKDNAKYDLYGVIQHFGSLNGGHYTAICKNDNNWVSYNDSSLDFISDPVTRNAYILFYIRKDLEKKRNNESDNEEIKEDKEVKEINTDENENKQ